MTRSVCMALGLWMSLLAAGFSADYVRVGALNIEHFGHPDHRQPVPAVAEYIYLSGVDVLALEEIYDTDNQPATRTNGKLDKVVEYLNGLPGQKWAYVLFAKKHAEETHQLTGIMWNQPRVSAVGEPFPVKLIDAPNDPFDSWERAPQAMKFSAGNGKTDLVLIPVHMSPWCRITTLSRRRSECSQTTIRRTPCRSGRVSRFAPITTPPTAKGKSPPATKVRFLPPSVFLSARDAGKLGVRSRRPASPPGRRHALLLSGCQDTEYSYDAWFMGRPNGAFTCQFLFF